MTGASIPVDDATWLTNSRSASRRITGTFYAVASWVSSAHEKSVRQAKANTELLAERELR